MFFSVAAETSTCSRPPLQVAINFNFVAFEINSFDTGQKCTIKISASTISLYNCSGAFSASGPFNSRFCALLLKSNLSFVSHSIETISSFSSVASSFAASSSKDGATTISPTTTTFIYLAS